MRLRLALFCILLLQPWQVSAAGEDETFGNFVRAIAEGHYLAVERMLEQLDTPTFLIILRHSEGYQKDLVAANKGFKWKKFAWAGLGVGLLGAAGLALKVWMDKKDKT